MKDNNLFQNETAEVQLPYDRVNMKPGTTITGFKPHRKINKFLDKADEIIFSMYWKPLGDSFLFLSLVRAVDDYYEISRPADKPKYVLDKKFSDLMLKVPLLSNAKVVKSGISYFKSSLRKGKQVFLVTDDDPFWENKNVPIFNSEEYKYPRYYEIINSDTIKYASRPARYYLTFERECSMILRSNPNYAIPRFAFSVDVAILAKYNIDYKNDEYITLISMSSKVEKKLGLLKYLKLAERYLALGKRHKVMFLVKPNEESPSVWLKFLSEINKLGSRVVLFPTEQNDFVELSSVLANARYVVSDDTGFGHLAAMSSIIGKNSPTVYIIYSKHDYTKWTTGTDNVIPIPTKLAMYLAKNNMSVKRDNIDQAKWGMNAYACSIDVDTIIRKIEMNKQWK